MRHSRLIIYGALGGLAVGVATMLLVGIIEGLPPDGITSTLIRAVHLPEGWLADALIDWLFPGNADLGLVIWFVLHPLYWAAIGAALASIYALIRRRHTPKTLE